MHIKIPVASCSSCIKCIVVVALNWFFFAVLKTKSDHAVTDLNFWIPSSFDIGNLLKSHSSEKGGFSLKQMPTLAMDLVMCVLTSRTQSK